jgi:hypothetical protein
MCETMYRGLQTVAAQMAHTVNTLELIAVVTVVSISLLPPKYLVEADGIEPTTSCLQSTRSPS